MKTNKLGRLAIAFVAAMALARPAWAAPDPAVPAARMQSRTEDKTREPGLFGEYWWVPRSIMADEIHPTDAGYDIWMNALAPHIDELR